jgi:lysyl-tRNA synthetase class 2
MSALPGVVKDSLVFAWYSTAMSTLSKRPRLVLRRQLVRALQEELEALGYEEVETPILVRAPGLEPAIQAFRTDFIPELGNVPARPLWLHTSPEYAMKRLLADGWERIYQFTRVFRNGEVSPTHNPEFTMLEFYRSGADYHALMTDLEQVVMRAARKLGLGDAFQWQGRANDLSQPFERLTVRDSMLRATGLDIAALTELDALAAAARAKGHHVPDAPANWDDVFFSVFLSAVEPNLGRPRPTFLIEYPARMAALARLKPDDSAVAERFELYMAGMELANGFSELIDGDEQRRRFLLEQDERRQAGKEVYPLDEKFLAAVGRMPPASGVAVGLDRLAMLFTDAPTIADVQLFPADTEWR